MTESPQQNNLIARMFAPLKFKWGNARIRWQENLEQWKANRLLRRQYKESHEEPGFIELRIRRLRHFLFNVLDYDPTSSDLEDGGNKLREAFEMWSRRLKMRFASEVSLKDRIYDNVFYFLDYDPTLNETDEKRYWLSPALLLWFQRVVFSRWIEIVGVTALVVIGTVCYFSVAAA